MYSVEAEQQSGTELRVEESRWAAGCLRRACTEGAENALALRAWVSPGLALRARVCPELALCARTLLT
jgi:hypothetical protein